MRIKKYAKEVHKYENNFLDQHSKKRKSLVQSRTLPSTIAHARNVQSTMKVSLRTLYNNKAVLIT